MTKKLTTKITIIILTCIMSIGSLNIMKSLSIDNQSQTHGKYYNKDLYAKSNLKEIDVQEFNQPDLPDVSQTSEMTLDQEMAIEGFFEDISRREEDVKVYVNDQGYEKRLIFFEPIHEEINGQFEVFNDSWIIPYHVTETLNAFTENTHRSISIEQEKLTLVNKDIDSKVELQLTEEAYLNNNQDIQLNQDKQIQLAPYGFKTKTIIDSDSAIEDSYILSDHQSIEVSENKQIVYFKENNNIIMTQTMSSFINSSGVSEIPLGHYEVDIEANVATLKYIVASNSTLSYPIQTLSEQTLVYNASEGSLALYGVRSGGNNVNSADTSYNPGTSHPEPYTIVGKLDGSNWGLFGSDCSECTSPLNLGIVYFKNWENIQDWIGVDREIISSNLVLTDQTHMKYTQPMNLDVVMLSPKFGGNPNQGYEILHSNDVTFNHFYKGYYLNTLNYHQLINTVSLPTKTQNIITKQSIDITAAMQTWYDMGNDSMHHGLLLRAESFYARVFSNHGADDDKKPYIEVVTKESGQISNEFDVNQTKLHVRPFTINKPKEGILAFAALGIDGITKPGSTVDVRIVDTTNNHEVYNNSTSNIGNNRLYPYYETDMLYPVDPFMQKYYKKTSNFQMPTWMIKTNDIKNNNLYQIEYRYKENGGSFSNWIKSDTFQIHKSSGFDQFKRIANFYGVTNLLGLRQDNNALDLMLIESNVIMIRNPQKNQGKPYQYTELSAKDKELIDLNLIGRNKECEYGYEPINVNTGNFYYNNPDLTFLDFGKQFMIERHYNSKDPGIDSIIGKQWNLGIDYRLFFRETGDLLFNDGTGRILTFVMQNDGKYLSPYGENYSLEKKVDHQESRIVDSGYYDEEDSPIQKTETIDIYHYYVTDENQKIYHFDQYGTIVDVTIDSYGHQWKYEHNEFGGITKFITASQKVFTFEYQIDGYISKIIAPDSSFVMYQYDNKGNLIQFIDQGNLSIHYNYEDSNPYLLTSFTERENQSNVVTNTYDEKGRVTKQIDALNQTATFKYLDDHTEVIGFKGEKELVYFDAMGYTTKVINEGHVEKEKTYNLQGEVSSLINSVGLEERFEYDEKGRLIKEWNTLNEVREYTYNDQDLVISIKGFDQQTTTYEYNAYRQQTKITHPDGKEEITLYNSDGQISYKKDLYGAETWYEYHSGDLIKQTQGNGIFFEFVNNPLGVQIAKIDALGNKIEYVYDKRGLVIEEKHPDYRVLKQYDGNGNLVSRTDGNGHVTVYEYDGWSRLVKETDAYGSKQYKYDELGNVCEEIDELGYIKRFVYNKQNQLIESYDELNQKTSYEYDQLGRKVKMINPMNQETIYHYNELSQLIKEQTPSLTTTYSYDQSGRVIRVEDSHQNINETVYDELGRVIKGIQNGVETTYEYDGLQKISETSLGQTLYYNYNAYGQLVSEANQEGIITEYTYDTRGLVASALSYHLIETNYSYDANYRLVKTTNADGMGKQTVYDANGNEVEVIDELGNKTVKVYSPRNQLLQEITPEGIVKSNSYDAKGQLIDESIYDPITSKTTHTKYEYNALGQKVKMIDSLNRVTSYTYDVLGRLIEEDFEGRVKYTKYNDLGQVIEIHTYLDTITYSYDDRDLQIEEDSKVYGKTTKIYDENKLLIETIDSNQLSTKTIYDDYQRVIQTIDQRGLSTFIEYDSLNRKIKEIDIYGQETLYEYNELGQVSKIIQNGVEATTTFNHLGLPIENYVDGKKIKTIVYDSKGQIIETYDALNNKEVNVYNSDGQIVETINKMGASTKQFYNATGQVVKSIDALGYITQYIYDDGDRLIETIDPLGFSERKKYDTFDREIEVTNKANQSIKYVYDDKDHLIKEIRPGGEVIIYDYDGKGHKIKEISPNGNQTLYFYNHLDQMVKQINPNQRIIENEYNEFGDLLVSKDDLGTLKKYQYDKYGRVIEETDLLELSTNYIYNELNQLVQTNYPNGLSEVVTYDQFGRIEKEISQRGIETQYEYDALDRVIHSYNNQNQETFYQYNAIGNVIYESNGQNELHYTFDQLGQNIKVCDEAGVQSFIEYDALGRVVKTIDERDYRTHFEYDALGNVTKETNALGQVIKKAYNEQGLLWKQTDAYGHITEYLYDKEGNNKEIIYQNNLSRIFYYDEMNQIIKVEDIDKVIESYTYDIRGRKTRYSNPTQDIKTVYNAFDQMIHQESGKDFRTYQYDTLGRASSITNNEGTLNFKYNVYSEIIEFNDINNQSIQYAYDLLGNQTQIIYPTGKIVNYTYNQYSQLVHVDGEEEILYTYNAKGQVVSKTIGDVETINEYDDSNHLIGVTHKKNGQNISEYRYVLDGLGQILSTYAIENQIESWTTYKYDQSNQLINSTYQSEDVIITHDYRYDVYGNKLEDKMLINDYEQTERYLYNEVKQLSAIVNDDETINYKYDKSGNVVVKDYGDYKESFSYDGFNQLNKISNT